MFQSPRAKPKLTRARFSQFFTQSLTLLIGLWQGEKRKSEDDPPTETAAEQPSDKSDSAEANAATHPVAKKVKVAPSLDSSQSSSSSSSVATSESALKVCVSLNARD